LQFECEQGRDLGFDGKSLIHPAQIDLANQVFAPLGSEIVLAQRQIEAFKQASDASQGVVVVDGIIVGNLHVESAQRLLAKAQVIAKQAFTEQVGM
jgi:(3S)-malyl-CoA thioesterase